MKRFKQYSLTLIKEDVSSTISSSLRKKFPGKITITRQDNLLNIIFDLGRTATKFASSKNPEEEKLRKLAVDLSNKLIRELRRTISIEETDISYNPRDPEVILFMVSDEFMKMNYKNLIIKEDAGTSLGSVKPEEKEVDKVKLKQKQDKDTFSDRQSAEMSSARKRDFDKAEQDRKSDEIEKKNKQRAKDSLKEVLEDGTDELVDSYKEYVPGQDSFSSKVKYNN